MHNTPKNTISFLLRGRYALFTDPITKLGGEKCSYHVPTHEAIKGVLKSIYWKPTLIWHVDKVRVMKSIRTQTKGVKPLVWNGGNSLAIYTFLHDVEYQVQAHFEWNMHRSELENDRNDGKHFSMAQRALDRGGRQDIFLGTRDCQGYVEPCKFGEGASSYDSIDELGFGLMFHGFDYPDETGVDELQASFWRATMKGSVIDFSESKQSMVKRFIRPMSKKEFGLGVNQLGVEAEERFALSQEAAL
jgi:CRISPR-associated protein Cas5d